MADGRKNNGGHSTKGFAGRKPKAVELKAAENLRSVLSDSVVVKKLAEKVKSGDMKAIELWLAYIYGKPNQPTTGDFQIEVKPPISWV